MSIRRCQHIKVNGTQCASPALRNQKHCYFHKRWYQQSMQVRLNVKVEEGGTLTLPTLEDANSIQLALSEILRLLASGQLDHKPAALMLYALQTASTNLHRTTFEPEPTRVVIDSECVEQRPIGATAWSTVEGCQFDDAAAREIAEKVVAQDGDVEPTLDSMLTSLIAHAARNRGTSH
jgi:hypothetical protein